jgi:hypothetical protein
LTGKLEEKDHSESLEVDAEEIVKTDLAKTRFWGVDWITVT